MKKVFLSLFWTVSLGLAFYAGKNSVSPKKIIETQEIIKFKEKIVSKDDLSQRSENDDGKTLKKEKKKRVDHDEYYQKRYNFLTKENGREEAKIDCRDGKEYACWKLEEYYRMTGQKDKLLKLITSNCDGEKVESCVSLYNLSEGKSTKKKITSKLKQSCKKNNAKACVSLGNIIDFGDRQVDKMAFKLREKGCELDVKTCDSLASSLHQANDARAGEFYLKSCEAGGKHSCMRASHYFYETGQKDEAGQVLRMGCDQNESYECRQYYDFLLANKRVDDANSFKDRACENEKMKSFFYCKKPN